MEKNMEDKVFEKDFQQLTQSERDAYSDLFSTEEEFNAIKDLYAGIARYRENIVDTKYVVKEKLDVIFQQEFGEQTFLNWRQISRVAAVLTILLGSLIWWMLQKESGYSQRSKFTSYSKNSEDSVSTISRSSIHAKLSKKQPKESVAFIASSAPPLRMPNPNLSVREKQVFEEVPMRFASDATQMEFSVEQQENREDLFSTAKRSSMTTAPPVMATPSMVPDLKDGIYEEGKSINYSSEWNDSLLLLVHPVFQ